MMLQALLDNLDGDVDKAHAGLQSETAHADKVRTLACCSVIIYSLYDRLTGKVEIANFTSVLSS
jgi:hypothetical protein